MTTGSAWSVALIGVDATMVEVEAAIGSGLPRTILVGLPDAALYEARDRCRAAFNGAGLSWPDRLLTINLTPASLPKAGTHYDLSIVTSILIATKMVPKDIASSTVLMGEVGLDARVRPVRGVLPGLLGARAAGFTRAIVPAEQVGEAELVGGMTVWGVSCLSDLVEVLNGRPVLTQLSTVEEPTFEEEFIPDFADVVGQNHAKWALEVAAAGRHHIYFYGEPGLGKTMLAERLPSILPDLTDEEAVEVSAVQSLAGVRLEQGLIRRPPFINPHHSISMAALVGGGARVIKPGAISLAHRGVLFLDEAPEFGARALDALRTPLESGWVTISRSQVTARYPARFQLILAANPCPCGASGVSGGCHCTPMAIRKYQDRVSGPVRDRIDIKVQFVPLKKTLIGVKANNAESSSVIKDRVLAARDRSAYRLRDTDWSTNAEVPGHYLREHLPLPKKLWVLDDALNRGLISFRGVDKVLRLAWTLADLAGRDEPELDHLQAAMLLRNGGVSR